MNLAEFRSDPASWARQTVAAFLAKSPANQLGGPLDEPAWEQALVGFAAGDDALWTRYKDVVGPFHYTPAELFNLHYPERPAQPRDLTVIAYVLAQSEATKADNRKEVFHPSERWVRARFAGEDCNAALRQHLVERLAAQGVDALAPQLSPHWRKEKSERYWLASRWSERHAAHAAGLGTFGVCDGLITPVGKAVRVGSVIARASIPATPRPYQHYREYCLYYRKGACLACVRRCPVGALSRAGHDKPTCWDHAGGTCAQYSREHFNLDGYGCGLCQTKVPCESGIPGVACRDGHIRVGSRAATGVHGSGGAWPPSGPRALP